MFMEHTKYYVVYFLNFKLRQYLNTYMKNKKCLLSYLSNNILRIYENFYEEPREKTDFSLEKHKAGKF